jgi:hypothetical protein
LAAVAVGALTAPRSYHLIHLVLHYCVHDPQANLRAERFDLNDHLAQQLIHRPTQGQVLLIDLSPRTFSGDFPRFYSTLSHGLVLLSLVIFLPA